MLCLSAHASCRLATIRKVVGSVHTHLLKVQLLVAQLVWWCSFGRASPAQRFHLKGTLPAYYRTDMGSK